MLVTQTLYFVHKKIIPILSVFVHYIDLVFGLLAKKKKSHLKVLYVTFGPIAVKQQNCMHFAEEYCFGCVTVQMNMVILLLIKHYLLGLRDITSLDGKDLRLTS